MEALRSVCRGIDRISQGFAWISDWLVLFAVLISAANAVVRYLFSYSSNAFLEVQWYMFGAMVLLGAAYTLRMNEHVRVDLIYSAVSPRTQLWIDIVGFAVFFLPVMIYLTWLSWPFFWQSFKSGEYSNSPGGLILWPAKMLVPMGFGLLTLQGFSELAKRILALEGVIEIDARYEKPVQ
ncbi:TRAP transporter small permease subunit [Enterovirga rhinocerotis]|uniref:TRAP transporter small permease protein n=1 Tax=Enterovirga rhinocerotis TaxID=1339210 RepID=A0A4R7C8V4_9HYPH|nr:TRAP transporter small permease subunit [Enterovirga rhinocerotis]TDR94422.1 TRAP-type mannitol/chloroaromatic compound transport system permease small subunit [Enterovirga rhinocerotis]